MATLFLIIIYLAFISLGLPDSLLGTGWPTMRMEWNMPFEFAGYISMAITVCTIVSSLLSGKIIAKLGTGKVTFISCVMTCTALIGFFASPNAYWLFLFAIPLGLGAGTVDSGLNNYVALHYKAHHMSWLHCFWGVGATLGPIIMAMFINRDGAWRKGYFAVAMIQLVLVIVLFLSLPLWDKIAKLRGNSGYDEKEESTDTIIHTNTKPIKIKGVKYAMAAFLFYCGAEAAVGLWGSSYLVEVRELDIGMAAAWVSFYYAGITVGRLITGFITMKLDNKWLILLGGGLAGLGTILLIVPLPNIFILIAFILIGLGAAPIFPCMIHETPLRFGKKHSQTIIGYQMASAYTGTSFFAPLIGFLAARLSIIIFPIVVLIYFIMVLLCTLRINGIVNSKLERGQNV